MNIFQLFIDIFNNQDLLFKFVLMILISLYGLFALILFIQIGNLNRILNQIKFSPIFKLISFLHLAATLALLIFVVIFL